MKNRFENDAPGGVDPQFVGGPGGRRGFVWSMGGSWFSGYTEWTERLGMRNLAVTSGKSHDTLEEAYARAASLATKENADV